MEWFPGGTPVRELLDSVIGGRPAYLTNRDGHGAWVNSPGAGAGRGDRRHARPGRRPDRARRRTASRRAPCTRAPRCWSAAWCPGPTCAEQLRGLLLAQQHLHALGITAWQDAIVGEYLGYPDPLPAYLAAAAGRHAHRAGRGRAVVGPRPRRRAAGRPARPAAGGPGGPVPGRHGQDHAGRGRGELHRRDDRPLPGWLRLPDRQQRAVLRGSGRPGRAGDPAGRRGLRGACARHRGPGGARGAGRVRRPRGPPTWSARAGTTSRTSR